MKIAVFPPGLRTHADRAPGRRPEPGARPIAAKAAAAADGSLWRIPRLPAAGRAMAQAAGRRRRRRLMQGLVSALKHAAEPHVLSACD